MVDKYGYILIFNLTIEGYTLIFNYSILGNNLMDKLQRILLIEQMDARFKNMTSLREIDIPSGGWINSIRMALNMSLVQLGRRLGKTSVSVREIEQRERDGGITLNKLREVGEALDLQFVYAFIPKRDSLEKMIERRADKLARDIVTRSSLSMKLENQEIRGERLEREIRDRAASLKREMPKFLWD